ncbi:hypothetical protein ACEPUD_07565 [Burkholderia ubonensis]|nr:hypothetical protein [Burkholderia ubonensis]
MIESSCARGFVFMIGRAGGQKDARGAAAREFLQKIAKPID